MNIQKYLSEKSVTQLTLGKSGVDVYDIDGEKILKHVCRDKPSHMKAANTITTFRFWHAFLHGSSAERVKGIYEKMKDI